MVTIAHIPGSAILHGGRVPHSTQELISGYRFNLVIWFNIIGSVNFDRLPVDLKAYIIQKYMMNLETIMQLSQTSKLYYKICCSDDIWRNLYSLKYHFPPIRSSNYGRKLDPNPYIPYPIQTNPSRLSGMILEQPTLRIPILSMKEKPVTKSHEVNPEPKQLNLMDVTNWRQFYQGVYRQNNDDSRIETKMKHLPMKSSISEYSTFLNHNLLREHEVGFCFDNVDFNLVENQIHYK